MMLDACSLQRQQQLKTLRHEYLFIPPCSSIPLEQIDDLDLVIDESKRLSVLRA